MLKTEQMSLGQLLSGAHRFTIPTYQREYTWEQVHIEALIDDLENALDARTRGQLAPYFLGQIILCAEIDGPDVVPRRVDVVDGQQRLISVVLLLAALRDLGGSDPVATRLHQALEASPGIYHLALRGEEATLLASLAQARGATQKKTPRADDQTSETARCLIGNRHTVLRRINQMRAAERKAFATFILEHCVVHVSTTRDVDYALQIYLSLNNRGKHLSAVDILHGEIVGPLSAADRVRYAAILDEFVKYRKISTRPPKQTSKTFFSHLVGAIAGAPDRVVRPIRDEMKAAGGAAKFADTVFKPMADAYRIVMPGSTDREQLSPRARAALERLDWFDVHANDDYISTAMLAATIFSLDGPEFAELLERVDVFAHVAAICGYGRPKRMKQYAEVNRALRALRDKRTEMPPYEELFRVPKEDRNKGLITLARKMMDGNNTLCRLLLIRIEAETSGRPLTDFAPFLETPPNHKDALTVEHLIPKAKNLKAASSAYWRKHFRSDEDRIAASQYFGNFALLRRGENEECDQEAFPIKKGILFGPAGGRMHPFVTTGELAELADFNHAALTARHTRMMEIATRLWPFGDAAVPQEPRRRARS